MKTLPMGIGLFLLGCGIFGFYGARAEGPTAAGAQAQLQIALKTALEDMNANAEERKLFELEVLPAPMAFVANSSSGNAQMHADAEKLKQFLKFSAASVQSPDMVCVAVRASPDCPTCKSIRPEVQKWFAGRLERRGFKVKAGPLGDEDAPLRYDDYAMRAAESQCASLAYAELSQERSADEDEDSTDVKVRFNSVLQLSKRTKTRGSAVGMVPAAESAEFDKDALSKTMTKILSSATAEMFSVAMSAASQQPMKLASEEKYFRVEGIPDFQTYAQIKQALSSVAPGLKLEERIIAPGSFQFAVSGMDLGELARIVRGLNAPKMTIKQVSTLELTVAVLK